MTLPLSPLVGLSDDPRIRRIEVLSRKLATANVAYDKWDRYYSGDQPMAFLAPEVKAQVGERLTPLVINWPETITDSVNRRVRPLGFLLGDASTPDEELTRIFAANGMFDDAALGQVDALVHGLGFIGVWGNEEDPETPLMVFDSAHQVAVDYVPGSGDRVLRDAVKRWQDEDTVRANFYTPDAVFKYRSTAQAWGAAAPSYELIEVLDNPLGAVPFAPMVNKGRLLNRGGRSELASIAPIADNINELADGLMVTARFYLAPRRYMTGVDIPTDPAEKARFAAEMRAYQEEAAASKVWIGGQDVKYGQFPEADLAGFVSAINLLTSSLAAIGGLPPDDLGLNTTNPASAEARRAAETTLILRAEEKQSAFGRAYTRAMRMAVAARDGIPLSAVPSEFSRMAVDWKDPATPAIAQAMDAAVKGKAEGIYDTEAAQQRVGMGPAERLAMATRIAEREGTEQQGPRFAQVGLPALVEGGIVSLDEARELLGIEGPAPALVTPATADVATKLELARELQQRDGLTQNAALAAVGLTQAAATNRAESAAPPPGA